METYITIIGTAITAIGTGVTLWQASKVKSYGKQIKFDLRKIHLYEICDFLVRSQDECRKLLSQDPQLNRGKNMISIIDNMQSYIDKSLNHLHLNGPDSDLRDIILSSQNSLRDFRDTIDSSAQRRFASEMHITIQDSISMCKERISNLEYGVKK